jgi:hypothetical protein
MDEKKPNVFPQGMSQKEINNANETGDRIAKQFAEENKEEINTSDYSGVVGDGEQTAALRMKKNTEEQMRLREESLKKNDDIAAEMDRRRDAKKSNAPHQPNPYAYGETTRYLEPPLAQLPEETKTNTVVVDHDPYIEVISQPQMNQAFDVIPLPSQGKLYPSKKKSVKVAYLTTADENILTSPNLIESGDFLEILINRKLLEPGLRYKDLHTGDRNAIMIWLRSTGYGEKYPVQILDRNGIPFETVVDLNELKTIELAATPDGEGLFTFVTPLSKKTLKFKLLTVGAVDSIEAMVDADKERGDLINNEATYVLEHQIVDVDGNRDRGFIAEYVKNIRTLEVQKLREYIKTLECGIDLRIDVKTPGGESIRTFLPLNLNFFWPDAVL